MGQRALVMKIVVASGKGGTGKTLLATSLARALVDLGRAVTYIDADVEEPNGHLFLRPTGVEEQEVFSPVPFLPTGECSGCGECQKVCAFGAILAVPGGVIVLDQLCHGCGACLLACPDRALAEQPRRVGVVRTGDSEGISVAWGVVDVGEPRGEPVLEAALRHAPKGPEDIVIIDAAAGAACLAMGAVRAADQAILVTEPTPMGLHDVAMALRMTKISGIRATAVINRADLGDQGVGRFLRNQGVPVAARIPFDEAIAKAYAAGEMPLSTSAALQKGVMGVVRALGQEVAP